MTRWPVLPRLSWAFADNISDFYTRRIRRRSSPCRRLTCFQAVVTSNPTVRHPLAHEHVLPFRATSPRPAGHIAPPQRAVKILAYLLLFALLLPSTISAQEEPLTLDAENAIKLEELLRDGEKALALVETLRAALAAKEQEVAELREGLVAAKRQEAATLEERIRADERDKLRAESIGLLKDALAEYREALKEAREEIREQRKQASRDRLLGAIPLIGAFLLLFGLGR